MRMYVPEIGDVIQLTEDWTFDLHDESRNDSMNLVLGNIPTDRENLGWRRNRNAEPFVTTLSAGTQLKIDRIYIRKGNEEYSSLTFLVVDAADERIHPTTKNIPYAKSNGLRSWEIGYKKGPKRFWASLEDVNCIEFTVDPTSKPEHIGTPMFTGTSDFKNITPEQINMMRIVAKGVGISFASYEILMKDAVGLATEAETKEARTIGRSRMSWPKYMQARIGLEEIFNINLNVRNHPDSKHMVQKVRRMIVENLVD